MEFLNEYGLFLAKSLTILIAVLAATAGIMALAGRRGGAQKERLEVKHLNERYRQMGLTLKGAMLPQAEAKKLRKEEKHRAKARRKGRDTGEGGPRHRLFVINFHGDIRASAVAALREEVTAVLAAAEPEDEVLVRLESGGGLVHAYGLAASQLDRLRQRGIALTVAVDKVAASGGYMMACVADRILAAPFAVVGSIGVITQLPNFHRLLKRHEVDFEQITAGDYKRTLTLFGENTDTARQKLREEVEEVHRLFKSFVLEHRPQVEIEQVATGEHWHGARALELKLVDELRTSDDYLLVASESRELYEVRYIGKKPLVSRLLAAGSRMAELRPAPLAADPRPPTLL